MLELEVLRCRIALLVVKSNNGVRERTDRGLSSQTVKTVTSLKLQLYNAYTVSCDLGLASW